KRSPHFWVSKGCIWNRVIRVIAGKGMRVKQECQITSQDGNFCCPLFGVGGELIRIIQHIGVRFRAAESDDCVSKTQVEQGNGKNGQEYIQDVPDKCNIVDWFDYFLAAKQLLLERERSHG